MKTESKNEDVERISALSTVLDGYVTVPGTKFKIGLDPLIGLIPGIGDTVGGFLSLYLVYLAAKAGLPLQAVVRMIGNILVDQIVGAVPLIGDLFDFAWRSNLRNAGIVRRYIDDGAPLRARTPQQVSSIIITLLVGTAVLIVALTVIAILALVRLVSGG